MNHQHRRTSLFCDTQLAARLERVEAELIARSSEAARRRHPEAGGFVVPLAGGVASYAEPGSPLNKVAALGFADPPDDDELAAVEDAFRGVGSAVQAEVATLADPAIAARLTGRGYRLESFENVLGRALSDLPELVAPPGVEIRPCRDDEFDAWLAVLAEAVTAPDTQGVPSHEEFAEETLINALRDMAGAEMRQYLALRDGVVAGGGSLRIADGVAQLGGAATLPAHRRHGVQSALVAARLADAVAAGCDVAVVTTQPGSRSHHNVQRQGFDLLYSRAVLVRPADER